MTAAKQAQRTPLPDATEQFIAEAFRIRDAHVARIAELEMVLAALADAVAVTTRKPEHAGYVDKCVQDARAALKGQA